MAGIDAEQWAVLSPWLDELLDLDEPARSQRLAALQQQDPTLGERLADLLAQADQTGGQSFMAAPAVQSVMQSIADDVQAPELAGQAIGPYVLERELGQGGMGSVWLARRADGRFEGQVAIKFLKTGLFGAGSSGRFAREGQILARLSHPHIARLLDAGVQEGAQPYLVLEYVDGQPIDQFCQQQGLDVAARVRLFLDVLAAVAHAHARLILHRDLKPSNILVTGDGQVKLLDFGIAKLLDDATQAQTGAAATELTQRAGSAFTPQYAAPEQVQQADVTTATDVYALGVLLYVLLGGRHPTADDTHSQLDRLKAVVETEPRRLSLSAAESSDANQARQAKLLQGDLDTIVAKALKKKPSERYTNAQTLADDLRHWLAHEPISAMPDSRWYLAGRFVRRHRAAVAATSLAMLALISLTVFSVLEARRAEFAERQAEERRQQSDDLLAYMLGDFADKLRPIGKLDLLDSMGGRALKHLTAEAPARVNERLNRAKALTVIGEVRVARRELDAALEALRPAQALLDGDPPSADMVVNWYKAQGAAHFWAGQAAFVARKMEPASQDWGRYLASAERLLSMRPDDAQAMVEVSYARSALGSLALRQGRLPDAAESFKTSVAMKRRAMATLGAEQQVSLKTDLSSSLSWLGQSQLYGGQVDEAIDAWRNSIAELTGASTGKTPSSSARYNEAVARNWLAEALSEAGLLAQARAEATQAVTALRALVETDASNRSWQLTLLQARQMELQLSPLDAPALLKEQANLVHDLVEFETSASARRVHDHIRAARLEARVAQGAARELALDKLRHLRLTLNKELDSDPGQMGSARSLARIDLDLLAYTDETKVARTCDLAVEDSQRLRRGVGVDYVITAYWRALQRCDAARNLMPPVEDARNWLASAKCGVLCTQTK